MTRHITINNLKWWYFTCKLENKLVLWHWDFHSVNRNLPPTLVKQLNLWLVVHVYAISLTGILSLIFSTMERYTKNIIIYIIVYNCGPTEVNLWRAMMCQYYVPRIGMFKKSFKKNRIKMYSYRSLPLTFKKELIFIKVLIFFSNS